MSGPRIVFLGPGGALNPERYQPAMLVEAGATRVLLDTGGGLGVVRRLLACDIDPSSVGHIFLSHRHLDHVGGLEPLLLTMSYRAFRSERPVAAGGALHAGRERRGDPRVTRGGRRFRRAPLR